MLLEEQGGHEKKEKTAFKLRVYYVLLFIKPPAGSCSTIQLTAGKKI